MKILFTADLHIKLGAKNVPIDWAKDRYGLFIKQMNEAEKQSDLHIMGGDVFDRVPSVEELEVYFDIVGACSIRTLVYAGNHEATKKGKTFFTALKDVTNKLNPLVTVIDEIYEEPEFTLVPYEFIHKKGVWDNLDKGKALFSHIRGAIEPHVKPEIDLDLIEDFPVVFLGDLHSHSNSQRNMVYPGSPMTTSFHRNKVETGYLIIDTSNNYSWTWHAFDLPQLLRKTVSDTSEMVKTHPDHTIYEIEGNMVDLGSVENSELLDKKLVKRSTDVALMLDPGMSKREELKEYLTYIMELEDTMVTDLVSLFSEHYRED